MLVFSKPMIASKYFSGMGLPTHRKCRICGTLLSSSFLDANSFAKAYVASWWLINIKTRLAVDMMINSFIRLSVGQAQTYLELSNFTLCLRSLSFSLSRSIIYITVDSGSSTHSGKLNILDIFLKNKLT